MASVALFVGSADVGTGPHWTQVDPLYRSSTGWTQAGLDPYDGSRVVHWFTV